MIIITGEKALAREMPEFEDLGKRQIVGSAGSPVGHRKLQQFIKQHRAALINPFAPSKMQFKMTSNRRRWVHAFPMGKQVFILPFPTYYKFAAEFEKYLGKNMKNLHKRKFIIKYN